MGGQPRYVLLHHGVHDLSDPAPVVLVYYVQIVLVLVVLVVLFYFVRTGQCLWLWWLWCSWCLSTMSDPGGSAVVWNVLVGIELLLQVAGAVCKSAKAWTRLSTRLHQTAPGCTRLITQICDQIGSTSHVVTMACTNITINVSICARIRPRALTNKSQNCGNSESCDKICIKFWLLFT